MAKKKAESKKDSKTGVWKRNTIMTLLIVFVLYIGINLISRTDGARSFVADKISNGTRLPVALDDCGVTPLLGLRLRGLTFYGVEIPDVKVKFNWLSFLSKEKPFVRELDMRGLEVRLKRVPTTGYWEPLVLHGLGYRLGAVVGLNPARLQTADSLPKFPPYVINEKTRLQLSRSKMTWHDEQGSELAYITEADLSIDIGSFIDRKATQSVFECGHIKLGTGRLLRDFRLETFSFNDSEVVLVLEMSEHDGAYPEEFATRTLWQDLNGQLNSLSEL
jgi:hypothetical protein